MDVPFIGLLAELPAIGWSGVVRRHGKWRVKYMSSSHPSKWAHLCSRYHTK